MIDQVSEDIMVPSRIDMLHMTHDEKLKRTDFFVDANSFAYSTFWKNFAKESQ
jgi:hypothetical protein